MNVYSSLINKRSLLFLSPTGSKPQKSFRRSSYNYPRYELLKAGMQRLRGRVYLNDGAISQTDLSADGRHILDTDDRSWHLLSISECGEVLGCTRLLQHRRSATFDDLSLCESALASSDLWGGRLRAAVEQDLREAALANFSYVEVGGWAMAEKIRCTTECLRSVLAVYAWSRMVGGAIGVSTATERNGSASILRRLGGSPVSWDSIETPVYYDRRYGCRMQMLRYDSRFPAARYEALIGGIQKVFADVPVISPERFGWVPHFPGFTATSEAPSIGPSAAQLPA